MTAWKACRAGRPPEIPRWLEALEPRTTGLLAQEGMKLWHLENRAALGIRAGGVVYPVLNGELDEDLAAGARELLGRVGESWCVMGPAEWVEGCLPWMPRSRVFQRVSYHFQVRALALPTLADGEGEPRPATTDQAEQLFPLQEAYEKEEVLFHPSEFQPLASRLNFWKSLKTQEVVALWEDGSPVAKAGTNALTSKWAQIGGVYTRPDRRGHGLQKRLMTYLLHRLTLQNRGACLFVKKTNEAAAGLYRSLGFQDSGEFTIVYGQRVGLAQGFR